MSGSDFVEKVRVGVGLRDPMQVELAIRVGLDLAALNARAATGEDVAADLRVTTATAANLSEHARNVVGRELMAALQTTIAAALLA